MSAWSRPSHRNPNLPQPEVCHVCGVLTDHYRLIEGDVEGLRGYVVCDRHRWRDVPSYNDLRRDDPGVQAPDAGVRLPPIGGDFWWEDI